MKFISKNARGEDVKQKINTIIDLYATRKISQVQAASNNIMNQINNTKGKKKETVNNKYEELIEHIKMLSHCLIDCDRKPKQTGVLLRVLK